jgi:HD superfamily phosphohydrolase
LAKELHPDVNQNFTEQQKNLWYAVKRAYISGDLDSMRALSVMVNDSSFDSNKFDSLSNDNLNTQIELLIAGIEKLLSEIKQIRSTFPFNIEKELHNEEWMEEQNRKTEQQIEEAKAQKQKYEERLELLKSI